MRSKENSAVVERINRRYDRDKVPDRWLKVHKARGEKSAQDLGEYYTREEYHNVVHAHNVDIHALAKQLGVL